MFYAYSIMDCKLRYLLHSCKYYTLVQLRTEVMKTTTTPAKLNLSPNYTYLSFSSIVFFILWKRVAICIKDKAKNRYTHTVFNHSSLGTCKPCTSTYYIKRAFVCGGINKLINITNKS